MPLSIDEQLLPHRNAIDSIDAEILRLLNERAGHAHAIGELKGTGAVYRPEREVAVLRRIQDLNRGPLPDESVTRLFREIMSECLAVERPLTIAYLGPRGHLPSKPPSNISATPHTLWRVPPSTTASNKLKRAKPIIWWHR